MLDLRVSDDQRQHLAEGAALRYYRCSARDHQGMAVCSTVQIPAEVIEGFVVERVRGYEPNELLDYSGESFREGPSQSVLVLAMTFADGLLMDLA